MVTDALLKFMCTLYVAVTYLFSACLAVVQHLMHGSNQVGLVRGLVQKWNGDGGGARHRWVTMGNPFGKPSV